MNKLGVIVPFFGDNAVRKGHLSHVMAMLENADVDYAVMTDTTLDLFWQKELLCNRGIDLLQNKYLMCLDADTLFSNSDWAECICETLEHFTAVQCCGFYHQEFVTAESGVYTFLTTGQKQLVFCGGAWAFHRSVLEEMGGFFDKCIVGGGDTLLSCAAIDPSLLLRTGFRSYKPHVFEALFEWSRKLNSFATFGCAGLTGHCLPHGSKEGRQYYHRHKLLQDFELHHVHEGKWTISAPEALRVGVANYIKSIN